MKPIIVILSVLAFSVAILGPTSLRVTAQDANPKKKVAGPSPVGTWKWERSTEDSAIATQLTVVEKAGVFSGKLKDKDHELEIKNGKLKDGSFSFEVFPHPEQPDLAIKFSGKVSADQIKGTMNYASVGEVKSVPWTAKRDDPVNAVLGKWLLEFETPDGQALSFTIETKKQGQGLRLSFVDDDSAKIRNVKFKDGLLSFDSQQVYQEQPITVEWDLSIKGNHASGTLFYSFDNDAAESGEIEVTGERVK